MDNLQCDDRQMQTNQFTHELAILKKIYSEDPTKKTFVSLNILYVLQF